MHKTQIYIDGEMDTALRREALLQGVSKSELIRRLLRAALRLHDRPQFEGGIDGLIGAVDVEPFDHNRAAYE